MVESKFSLFQVQVKIKACFRTAFRPIDLGGTGYSVSVFHDLGKKITKQ
jgi:hypothetical protein